MHMTHWPLQSCHRAGEATAGALSHGEMAEKTLERWAVPCQQYSYSRGSRLPDLHGRKTHGDIFITRSSFGPEIQVKHEIQPPDLVCALSGLSVLAVAVDMYMTRTTSVQASVQTCWT